MQSCHGRHVTVTLVFPISWHSSCVCVNSTRKATRATMASKCVCVRVCVFVYACVCVCVCVCMSTCVCESECRVSGRV